VRGISTEDMNDLVQYLLQIDDREPAATTGLDEDGDLLLNEFDDDDDNDGIPDELDRFPLDASESLDQDNDGIGNNADTDDDNDGLSDQFERANSVAADGDSDGDGVADEFDLDSDNDSIPDAIEAGAEDADSDGKVAIDLQGSIESPPDADTDGVPDYLDRESNNSANSGSDFDITRGQYAALDTNADGVLNIDDDGYVDANADGADDRIVRDRNISVQVGGCSLQRGGAPDIALLVILLFSLAAARRRVMSVHPGTA